MRSPRERASSTATARGRAARGAQTGVQLPSSRNAGKRSPQLSEARAALAAEFGEEAAELMCHGNAAALIENRPARVADIRFPEEPAVRGGLAARLPSHLR